jgi:hypothetical protein
MQVTTATRIATAAHAAVVWGGSACLWQHALHRAAAAEHQLRVKVTARNAAAATAATVIQGGCVQQCLLNHAMVYGIHGAAAAEHQLQLDSMQTAMADQFR